MSDASPEVTAVLMGIIHVIDGYEKVLDSIRLTRDLTDAECDKADRLDACLDDLIRWIHRRTGIPVDDLWEFAHRANTPAGVGAGTRQTGKRGNGHEVVEWMARLTGTTTDRVARFVRVEREDKGEKVKYRDLSRIYGKLAKLDRTGEPAAFLAKLWEQYPSVASKLPKAGVFGTEAAGADQGDDGGKAATDPESEAHSQDAQEDKPVNGNWLIPTTLADMANRLRNITPRRAKPILKRYGLRNAGNRQLWTVRLDLMPSDMRQRLECAK